MNKIDRNIVKFWTLHSLALCLVPLTASAQIYKSVDENGVVTFSDVPPAASSGKTSTVVQPNVTNSMPGLSPTIASPEAVMIDESTARSVSIASPLNNATIPMGAGIFDVTAELGAPLAENELLALYLDDELVDSPQVNAVWTLTYVIRGPHTLQVRRLSRAGETISQSEKITVFVLRPSVLRATPR
ncbi:MAG: DUF4124 domain-containing protein [Pseudomonadota bacterium]|nr:DUF4124 domain-containing protein [Pseudomonadota bacterium]MED5540167.1 DUF4124 domain-containing protein [Pseudomonadota bacterium]